MNVLLAIIMVARLWRSTHSHSAKPLCKQRDRCGPVALQYSKKWLMPLNNLM
jgi:hypothetical protein